jgi:hypothetical protein
VEFVLEVLNTLTLQDVTISIKSTHRMAALKHIFVVNSQGCHYRAWKFKTIAGSLSSRYLEKFRRGVIEVYPQIFLLRL